MSKHNYSQYSDKKPVERVDAKSNKTNEFNNKVVNESEIKSIEEVDVINHADNAEVYEEVEIVTTTDAPKTVTGKIVDCTKLNIRYYPSMGAEVVAILPVDSEIIIDPEKSDNEWFKVCTATGIDGYCMRRFVDANL